MLRIGLLSPHRRLFWRLVARGARCGKAGLRSAVEYAVKGEHMIQYTKRHVLPRISESMALAATEQAPGGEILVRRSA